MNTEDRLKEKGENWVFKLNKVVKYNSGWDLSENYIYRDANKNDKIRMVITSGGGIFIFFPNIHGMVARQSSFL